MTRAPLVILALAAFLMWFPHPMAWAAGLVLPVAAVWIHHRTTRRP